MRTKLILIFSFLFYNVNIYSQENISVKDLELPSAPALTLLDESSTNIESPKDIQALTTTLINNINNNFAIEFSPYMFFKKSNRFYEYNSFNVVDNKMIKHDPWFSSTFKDLGISVAKIKKDNADHISIGLRTNLLKFVTKDYENKFVNIDKIFRDVPQNIDDYDSFVNVALEGDTISANKIFVKMEMYEIEKIDDSKELAILKTRYEISDKTLDILTSSKAEPNESLSQTIKRIKGYKEAKKNRDKYLRENYYNAYEKLTEKAYKPFFTLDVAAACSYFFEENIYSNGKMGRLGAWTTANLNINFGKDEDNYISLYLYNRYLKNQAKYDETTKKFIETEYFDVGGKLEVEISKISFAYEYIQRTKESNNYRSVGTIKYKFSETIILNGGFGKNFEKTDNLVSFLGISWGFEYDNEFKTQ
jgi:hypothetical protein